MLILTALLLAAPPSDAPPPKTEPVCRRADVTQASGATRPMLHPLGREPNATQVLAVLRTEGGCIKPVVVSDSVGASIRR